MGPDHPSERGDFTLCATDTSSLRARWTQQMHAAGASSRGDAYCRYHDCRKWLILIITTSRSYTHRNHVMSATMYGKLAAAYPRTRHSVGKA